MITFKLNLIRHGITASNLEQRYLGQRDEPLCPEGFAQIDDTLSRFEYPAVEAVYACPLARCRETAERLFPDAPITLVEDLTEMALGDFEGFTFDELKTEPAFEAWINDAANCPPPGGESSLQFSTRLSDGLEAVFMDMQRERIREAACVVSGGVIMSLVKRHTLAEESLASFAVEPLCGYSIRLSTQLWSSHRLIEVAGEIPNPK